MLSENIKRLRTEQGLTQAELAEQLHVVRQTVSKWEQGTSVPDALLLQKLAEIFGTDADSLLGTAKAAPKPTAQDVSRWVKPWLGLTIFWGLFLILAPTADVVNRYDSGGFIAVLLLCQARTYLAGPLFAACGTTALLRFLRERHVLQIPAPPTWLTHLCRWLGMGMALFGLYMSISFILMYRPRFLPMAAYVYLVSHDYLFTLWQTAAAVLLHLSCKESST